MGVNAINRVHNYFEWLRLKNLTLSNNMPIQMMERNFGFPFRSTLDEDLTTADFVFGEHSISMIDAAFKKGIPFSSVNLTKRRNFLLE